VFPSLQVHTEDYKGAVASSQLFFAFRI